MPNFAATNNFNCPHCNEMLNGATGFTEADKPVNDQFTICIFCHNLSVYVIENEKVSLRKLTDEDYKYIQDTGMQKEIDEMLAFLKSKPNK